jgi:hypothetical protein
VSPAVSAAGGDRPEGGDDDPTGSGAAELCAIVRAALPALLHRLIDRPTHGAFREAARHALPRLAHGAAHQSVAALAAALHGPVAEVTVPVAADRLLAWCERHPTVPG